MQAQKTPPLGVSRPGGSQAERYLAVRRRTEALCDPLETEGYVGS